MNEMLQLIKPLIKGPEKWPISDFVFFIRNRISDSPISAKDFYKVVSDDRGERFKKYPHVKDAPKLSSAIVCPEASGKQIFLSIMISGEE